jgi:peptidyl-prolyl cis-trans isomerase SurA
MRYHATRPHLVAVASALLLGSVAVLAGCDRGTEARADARGDKERPQAEFAASHVLVAFDGTVDRPAGLQRTRAEGLERARRIAVLLRTGRGDLADIARRYSDDPTAMRNGGNLGNFARGEMEPALEQAVLDLGVGEIGGPVETPFGWHVIRRDPVRVVRIHHLLVAHRDAIQVASQIDRSRAEALRIARALHHKVVCDGADLCDLTEQFSDDPQNRLVCGDLGWIEPGLLQPDVEQSVFGLEPGQVTPVLESDYGFHIFWRQ